MGETGDTTVADYQETIDLYVMAYREGYEKVDKTLPMAQQKVWVRNYAKREVPGAGALFSAMGGRVRGQPNSPEAEAGHIMVGLVRALQLWPERSKAVSVHVKAEQRKFKSKFDTYREVAENANFVPPDWMAAKFLGVTEADIQKERARLNFYRFEPFEYGFRVTKADPMFTPEGIAAIVTRVIKELQENANK